MRPRMRRRNLVVWSSSARQGVPAFARPARTTRIRRLIRTGALYAVIGLFRLARAVRARRHGRLLLAGAVLTAAGIVYEYKVVQSMGHYEAVRALVEPIAQWLLTRLKS